MIQILLQAVCGHNSAMRAYLHILHLELFVITGNYVTEPPE